MIDNNCIFCKLMSGEIPAATVHETEHFKVILDVNPATKGHCLVVPKRHFADVFEMDDEYLKEAFALAKETADRLMHELDCTGINILQNNGLSAGQTVFHFHIHVIPRYDGDFAGISWKPGTLDDETKKRLVNLW